MWPTRPLTCIRGDVLRLSRCEFEIQRRVSLRPERCAPALRLGHNVRSAFQRLPQAVCRYTSTPLRSAA